MAACDLAGYLVLRIGSVSSMAAGEDLQMMLGGVKRGADFRFSIKYTEGSYLSISDHISVNTADKLIWMPV